MCPVLDTVQTYGGIYTEQVGEVPNAALVEYIRCLATAR